MPAPLTAAAAIVGATERIPLLLSAVLLPLHDPIRVAEQLVVLDHLSRGRVWTVLGAGYRPEEFAMAGEDVKRRGQDARGAASACCSQAFTGEPFTYEGREVHGHARSRSPTRTRRSSWAAAWRRRPGGRRGCGSR